MGHNREVLGLIRSGGIPIPKQPQIEVHNKYTGKSYFTDLSSARALVQDKSGKWQGRKVIMNDTSKVTWGVRQSGHAGPLVMQVVVTCLVLFFSISPRFFPGFHHLQNMPQPVWVTVERA